MSVDLQTTLPVPVAERPRGLYPARVDAKGRLKLPSAFQKFIEALQQKNFFITTIDETTVYIFPLNEWKKKEAHLENPVNEDEVDLFNSLLFTADKYGADAVIDSEGRMLLPQLLRERFKIQDAQVWLQCRPDSIELLNEDEFHARERKADPAKLARANVALKLKERKLLV